MFSREDVTCQVRDRSVRRDVDRVAFDDPRLALRMRLICSRVRKGTTPPTADLIVPSELVLSRQCPNGLAGGRELDAFVETAFPEVPASERHSVLVHSGGSRLVLAVERSVADEAIGFARLHGFAPLSIVVAFPDGDVTILALEAPASETASEIRSGADSLTEPRKDSPPPADLAAMPMALRREMLRRRIVDFQKSTASARSANAAWRVGFRKLRPLAAQSFKKLSSPRIRVPAVLPGTLGRRLAALASTAQGLPGRGVLRVAVLSEQVAALRTQLVFRPVFGRLTSLRPDPGPLLSRLRQLRTSSGLAIVSGATRVRRGGEVIRGRVRASATVLVKRFTTVPRVPSVKFLRTDATGIAAVRRGGLRLRSEVGHRLSRSRSLGQTGLARTNLLMAATRSRSKAAYRILRDGALTRLDRAGLRILSVAKLARAAGHSLVSRVTHLSGPRTRAVALANRSSAAVGLVSNRIGLMTSSSATAFASVLGKASAGSRLAVSVLPSWAAVTGGPQAAGRRLQRVVAGVPLLPGLAAGAVVALAIGSALIGPVLWQRFVADAPIIAAAPVVDSVAPVVSVVAPPLPVLSGEPDFVALAAILPEAVPAPVAGEASQSLLAGGVLGVVRETSLASAEPALPAAIDLPPLAPSLVAAADTAAKATVVADTEVSSPVVAALVPAAGLSNDVSRAEVVAGKEPTVAIPDAGSASAEALALAAGPSYSIGDTTPSIVDPAPVGAQDTVDAAAVTPVAPEVAFVPPQVPAVASVETAPADDVLAVSLRPLARPDRADQTNESEAEAESLVSLLAPDAPVVASEASVRVEAGVSVELAGDLRVLAIAGSENGRQALVQTGSRRSEILRVGAVTSIGKVVQINRNGIVLLGSEGEVFLPFRG